MKSTKKSIGSKSKAKSSLKNLEGASSRKKSTSKSRRSSARSIK